LHQLRFQRINAGCVEVAVLIKRVFLRLVAKMRDRFLEKRINITFCVKLGKNASDTCAVLSETYGGKAMKKSGVSEWYKRLKEGRKNVEDDERSRPRSLRTDGNVEKVRNLTHSEGRLSIRPMAV
jgi:uncharacterized metal-binding protein